MDCWALGEASFWLVLYCTEFSEVLRPDYVGLFLLPPLNNELALSYSSSLFLSPETRLAPNPFILPSQVINHEPRTHT